MHQPTLQTGRPRLTAAWPEFTMQVGGGGGRTLVLCPEVQPGVRGVTGTRGCGHELLPTMASLLSQPLPRQEGHWLTGGRLGRCPPSVNVPSGL